MAFRHPLAWATSHQDVPIPVPTEPSLCKSSTRIHKSSQKSEPRRRTIPPVGREYFEAALLHADGECNYVGSNGVRARSPSTGWTPTQYLS
ncbi:hypothetical protein K439DRAFT_1637069 [Ramaria rubella]|nr:hypothetical protein K439DRAFT_1637069 [Ramaria rubella]